AAAARVRAVDRARRTTPASDEHAPSWRRRRESGARHAPADHGRAHAVRAPRRGGRTVGGRARHAIEGGVVVRHTDRIFVVGAATVEPSPPVPADALVASPPPVEPVTDDAPRAAAAGPEVEAKQPLVRQSEPVVAERPLTMDALQLAIDNDPFQESRRRPPERYRMPGDPIEDAGPPPPPPPPPFQVLGIAQLPGGGGSAIMQVEDAPPRVVSVGESLFGYTLDRVEGEV